MAAPGVLVVACTSIAMAGSILKSTKGRLAKVLRLDTRLDRYTRNQSGKRKVVVIVRERGGGPSRPSFSSESRTATFIRSRMAKGTTVHAEEAAAWDHLHERFEVKRINHQEATA